MDMAKTLFIIFVILLFAPSAVAEGQHTPENPSLILFLAGSAAAGYQYLKGHLRR